MIAGIAKPGNGAGLKTLCGSTPWVQIPLPALRSVRVVQPILSAFRAEDVGANPTRSIEK